MAVFLNADDPDFETAFATLLGAKREDSPDVQNVVAEIISEVRADGDKAVLRLTQKFDRLALTADQMRFSKDEIAQYCAEVGREDREALDGFLKQHHIPWITVHEKGGRHPALQKYGIQGIPTMFLVDQEGKVISLEARGEMLTQLLEKTLGK